MAQFEEPAAWSLADLYAEPAEKGIEQDLAEVEKLVCALEALRERLSPDISIADFQVALGMVEQMTRIKSRIVAYADLLLTGDTQDPRGLNLRDRVLQTLTDLGNRCLFFDLWFKDLPDEAAARLMAESGDLCYYLATIRRFKPYTLTEAEEKIISSKDINGIDAMVAIYLMITSAFKYTLEVDGETQTLTRDELMVHFDSPDADLRMRAYQELFRVYQENAVVLAQMYMHRVRDWHTEGMELRGYRSPIAPRNLENDLPDEVVETLLSVCRKNAPLFQRYFRLKAGWLGMPRLRRYDIYASLAPSDKTFDYGTGVQMVLDSYAAFSPEVAALVQRVLDEQHVDAQTRPNKAGGAFCYTAYPGLTPWVMLNYANHAHDVATLAHELGHAIHNMLADKHSALTQQASLPLAETASIFGEMLLKDRLLQMEQDPTVRRELLARSLDDAYLSVIRQAYFTIFEKDVHAMVAEGRTLDEITAHYLENLHEQFGDAVEVSDEFKWEWIGVSHMYEVPFYTYAYSFGLLLVLALYQQYRLEGEAFLPRYLRILAAGGSETPLKILGEAGLDVTSPAFWQGGFDVLEKMVTELEQSS
jgi:oligoendopeptidase F